MALATAAVYALRPIDAPIFEDLLRPVDIG
jgi:hypothetical protein